MPLAHELSQWPSFFCLLQEQMDSEGEADKPTRDIKR